MIGHEEEQAVMRVLRSGSLSGYQGNWSDAFYGGDEVKALEKEWAFYFGIKHACACNSATSGLWAACNAIGLTYGDEVIVTPYSMTCSATVPMMFGAFPVFADIEPDYYCMDPKSIESKFTEFTKAVIVVNLFGMPADYDRINKMCHERGVVVIEDSAQSIGAKYKHKYCGTLSDICVSSLNRHKHINAGEGRIVTTNSDDYDMKVRLSINHAEAVVNDMVMKGEDVNNSLKTIVGHNLRMTELSAAVAREQLKKLPSIIRQYQKFSEWFNTPLKTRIPIRPGCTSAFYKYATMDNENPNPALFNMKQHYIRPINRMPLFASLGYDPDECPVCDEVESKISLSWLKETV
jgi:perosamine synthetase